MKSMLQKLIAHVRAGGTLSGGSGEGDPPLVVQPPQPAPAPEGDGRTADALVKDVAENRARVERVERHLGLAQEEEVPVAPKQAKADDVVEEIDEDVDEAETDIDDDEGEDFFTALDRELEDFMSEKPSREARSA